MRGFPLLILAANLGVGFVQATVSLGSAATFGALSYASITNSGPTDIDGDIGTTGTSITGFPPGTYTGSKYIASQAIVAFESAEAAYEAVASLPGAITLTGNLGGRVLPPGVYQFPSSAQLTGVLTLAGTGSCHDAWYFKVGSTLTTGIGSAVVITGGASGSVFWAVGTSATIGIGTDFIGNILAAVSVILSAESSIQGGVFALGASITLNSAFIQPQASCPTIQSSSSSISSTSSAAPSSSSAAASSTTSSSTSSSFSAAQSSSTSSAAASSSSSAAASSTTSSSTSSSAAQSSSTSSSADPTMSNMAENVTVGISSTAVPMMFWTIRNVICLVMELLGSTVVAQTDLICISAGTSARPQHHALSLQPRRPRHPPALQHLRHRQAHPHPRPHRQLRVAQLPRCPPQQVARIAARLQHLRLPQFLKQLLD
ncbi:hypothetical protein N431DRAFT_194121 [Stipitochalara longipes BDJ]|nr:hypothetical protein N431DRAFT_194121 [Stipitochalara longipes BDJ]